MRFGSRWQRVQSYATAAAWFNAAYLDDEEFTFEDVDETIYAAVMLGLIWSPQIALAIPAAAALSLPLAVVEGAALAGLGISYAIGGAEGAADYIDYISNPEEIPFDRAKREAFMQASEIMVATTNPVAWVAGQGAQMIGELIGEYKSEIFKNRWSNPFGI